MTMKSPRRPRKRSVGRPALGDKARDRTIRVRLTPAEEATWQAAAERESLTLSDWLRGAAELAIARGSTR